MVDFEQVVKDAMPVFEERARKIASPNMQTFVFLAIESVREVLLKELDRSSAALYLRDNRERLMKHFDPVGDGIYAAWVRERGQRAMLNANHTILRTYGLQFLGGTAYPAMPHFDGEQVGERGWYFVPDMNPELPPALLKRNLGMWCLQLPNEDLSVFS